MSDKQRTRSEILKRDLKVLCRNHGVQPVLDAFVRPDAITLALECGCRRELEG